MWNTSRPDLAQSRFLSDPGTEVWRKALPCGKRLPHTGTQSLIRPEACTLKTTWIYEEAPRSLPEFRRTVTVMDLPWHEFLLTKKLGPFDFFLMYFGESSLVLILTRKTQQQWNISKALGNSCWSVESLPSSVVGGIDCQLSFYQWEWASQWSGDSRWCYVAGDIMTTSTNTWKQLFNCVLVPSNASMET